MDLVDMGLAGDGSQRDDVHAGNAEGADSAERPGVLRRVGAVAVVVAVALGWFVGGWSSAASAQEPDPPGGPDSSTTTVPPTTVPPTTTTPPPPPPPPPAPRPAPAPAPPPPAPAPPPLNPWDWAVNHLHLDLANQRVNVIANNGWNLRSMPVSSGANGKTPRGTFHIYSRSAWTTSSSDGRVSMRWMTRFRGGIGFHGIPRRGGVALPTPLGQRPVSAGCVRMHDWDAEWIFHNIPTGTRVVVK